MATALRMVAGGEGDAVVSAGNTGALFIGATGYVHCAEGVRRAALASVIPMEKPLLLLDCGANAEVTPEFLVQFAHLGSIYMNRVMGVEKPRVGLLNNGAEECKGTPLQQAAYKRLAQNGSINFVGNIEGSVAPFDTCDVLVTDGFTGNIYLKSVEGLGKMLLKRLKSILYSSVATKAAALTMKKQFDAMKKDYDSSEHGGAPILGISKPVIKAHGSSDAKAFKNAIRQAINYADSGVIYDIAEAAQEYAERKKAERELQKQQSEESDR
jgi:glycerol-3-phosphate acyltransferase PlsX